MSLETFGRAVGRKLLIDDHLRLLGDMTGAMGQAAAQTEADELVKLLTGTPALSDGQPVFHASRGNGATVDLPDDRAGQAIHARRPHLWFGPMVREAGLPEGLSPHGSRNARCRRFAEAGRTAYEIMANFQPWIAGRGDAIRRRRQP